MEKDIIYIAGNPNAYPLEYYNPDAQCYQGVIPELLNWFSEQSRYDVRYYAPDQGGRREELAASQQVDLISCLENAGAVPHRVGEDKAFILGTYHGLPKKYLQSYLDEYSFRFSRRDFGAALLERLTLAISLSRLAD